MNTFQWFCLANTLFAKSALSYLGFASIQNPPSGAVKFALESNQTLLGKRILFRLRKSHTAKAEISEAQLKISKGSPGVNRQLTDPRQGRFRIGLQQKREG